MKTAHYLFIVILVLPAVCFGRLGDSESELVSRFGAPDSKGNEITLTQGKIVVFGSKLSFRQEDWTIECAVIEDRCAREIYSKKGDWTEDQFATVLSSNAQGESWTEVSKEMTKYLIREWRRGDGGTAVWHLGGGMVVANPAYDRAKSKAEGKAKAEASQIPKI